jgi:hypothetical protein
MIMAQANVQEFDQLTDVLTQFDKQGRTILRYILNGSMANIPEDAKLDEDVMVRVEKRLVALAETMKLRPPIYFQFYNRANGDGGKGGGPEILWCRFRCNIADCLFWLLDNRILVEERRFRVRQP